MTDSPTGPLEKKRKTAPTLPQEVTGIIRIFYGLPGSETVSGFLHSYRDAQRLYRAAEIEFVAGASGGNVRCAKAYAKQLKTLAALNIVWRR